MKTGHKYLSLYTCHLYAFMGDAGDVLRQQDENSSCTLSLSFSVLFSCEVLHLHDDTAAGQHRLIGGPGLCHHNSSAATSAHKKGTIGNSIVLYMYVLILKKYGRHF